MAPVKVLVLHGYAQNASILSKRMATIRKTCGKDIEFVFIDAPRVLQAADVEGFGIDITDMAPEDALRGWWTSDLSRTRLKEDELDESLAFLRDVLAKDHFEGVFGFSQGAVLATILAGLLERPEMHPPFLIDGKPPHPPLTFCIAVAGFLSPNERWARFLKPSYSTPTLHVFGLADPLVSPDQSRTLVNVNDSMYALVAPHEGGHFVPSKASWRNFFRDYIKDPLGNVPVPPVIGTEVDGGNKEGATNINS